MALTSRFGSGASSGFGLETNWDSPTPNGGLHSWPSIAIRAASRMLCFLNGKRMRSDEGAQDDLGESRFGKHNAV